MPGSNATNNSNKQNIAKSASITKLMDSIFSVLDPDGEGHFTFDQLKSTVGNEQDTRSLFPRIEELFNAVQDGKVYSSDWKDYWAPFTNTEVQPPSCALGVCHFEMPTLQCEMPLKRMKQRLNIAPQSVTSSQTGANKKPENAARQLYKLPGSSHIEQQKEKPLSELQQKLQKQRTMVDEKRQANVFGGSNSTDSESQVKDDIAKGSAASGEDEKERSEGLGVGMSTIAKDDGHDLSKDGFVKIKKWLVQNGIRCIHCLEYRF